jgi:hypothetical protein
MVTEGSQASEAEAIPNSGAPGQLMGETGAVGQVITGGVLSRTMMVWLTWLLWFPQTSVASQVTVRL